MAKKASVNPFLTLLTRGVGEKGISEREINFSTRGLSQEVCELHVAQRFVAEGILFILIPELILLRADNFTR